jgi:hypothetical protein
VAQLWRQQQRGPGAGYDHGAKSSAWMVLSNLTPRVDARRIKKLRRNLGITTLYVTHDQEEALTLSTG